MAEKICDHTSVGILVKQDDKLLLIERKKPPFGFAPPAGHVDDKGSYENAAKEELKEEVGLDGIDFKLVLEGRKENHCRREDGTWHHWKIYEAEGDKELKRSPDETKQAGWYSLHEVRWLGNRTESYLNGEIPQADWEKSPGLEPVWYEMLKELRVISPQKMRYQYFIASRWRNRDSVLELTNKLRGKGKTVYCFIEGDGTGYQLKDKEKKYNPEEFMQHFENIPNWVNDPAVREIFDVDMNALRRSESLILLLPAGKSAHLEAGVAYGMRKKCILIGEQQETESSYLIFSEFYSSIENFINTLG